VAAIDRQLDGKVRDDFDHLGGVLGRDRFAVGAGAGDRGGVAQVAADGGFDEGGANFAAGQVAEFNRGDLQGRIVDEDIGNQGGAGIRNNEHER
jgi:hypothetical protein